MRLHLPSVKKGDLLTAERVNTLGRGVRAAATMMPVSGGRGIATGSGMAMMPGGGGSSGTSLILIILVEVLLPGGEAAATLYDDDTEITVSDPLYQNFGLVGERLYTFKSTNEADEVVYKVVGSSGLRRRATADVSIAVDGSGSVSIIAHGADSGTDVTAAFNWMASGSAIAPGTELIVTYFDYESGWVIDGVGC